jgi:hypothetical protein
VPSRLLITLIFVGALGTAGPLPALSQHQTCGHSLNVPLSDLTGSYRGLDFGLYPGRRTTPPDTHLATGLERARKVQPLDANGRPSPDGKIVLLSLGMSNTGTEFGRFMASAARTPAINRKLVLLNGTLSGADAPAWTVAAGAPWQHAIAAVNSGGQSAKQVQIIWLKQARLRTAPFPNEIELLKADLASALRIAKSVFPNLQLVYLSSRTRSGAEARRGPAEPQAYETAFAVRSLIHDQMTGAGNVGLDATGWISWGPYLWSNGTPRSDGLVWACDDLRKDMLHPTESGDKKVSEQLMAFFMTADTSAPWFLDASASRGGADQLRIAPATARGAAPLTVDFSSEGFVPAEVFWSFEDGTFSREQRARKTFHLEGRYDVRLTALDASGKWARASSVIHIGPRIN